MESDGKFSTLVKVAIEKSQATHDANLFSIVCNKVTSDLWLLDTCIKVFRKCLQGGKDLYVKCTLYFKYEKDIEGDIKEKEVELKSIVDELQNLNAQITNLEARISSVHDQLRLLELRKERTIKKSSLLREHLTLKIDHLQRQLKECTDTKDSYTRFFYSYLNAVELASYDVFVLINISEEIKDNWDKEFTSLKRTFGECMALINSKKSWC